METKQLEVTKEQLFEYSEKTKFSNFNKDFFDIIKGVDENIESLEVDEEFKIFCNISDSILDVEYDEEMIENDDDDMYTRDSKAEARHEFLQEKYEERKLEEIENFYEEIDNFFNIDSFDYYGADGISVWINCILK